MVYIDWDKLFDGYINLKNDGGCDKDRELVECVSFFYNSEGRWVKCYTSKIVVSDAFHV